MWGLLDSNHTCPKWFCFRCLNKSQGPGLRQAPKKDIHIFGVYSLVEGHSDVTIPEWGVYLNKCQGCSLATSNLHVTIARRIPKPSSKYSSPCSKHIALWWGDELQYRVERMWRKISCYQQYFSISNESLRNGSLSKERTEVAGNTTKDYIEIAEGACGKWPFKSASGDDLYRMPKLEPTKIPRQSRSLYIYIHTYTWFMYT